MSPPCILHVHLGIDGWCDRHRTWHQGHLRQFALGLDPISIRWRETWDKTIRPSQQSVKLINPVALPQVTVRPHSQLLVISVAVGDEGRALHSITGDSHREYAKRCHADYVCINGKSICPEWTMMDKFRVRSYAEHYERILYIDADILVRRKAKDLFELYPWEVIGIHDDTGYQRDWDYMFEVRGVCSTQGLPVPANYRLLNSGIVLFSQQHASIWDPPTQPIPNHWCSEQHLEAIRILNERIPWAPLPRVFNWMWWINRFHPDPQADDAEIIHAAGMTGMGGKAIDRYNWLEARRREDAAGLAMFTIDVSKTRLTDEIERCQHLGAHLTSDEIKKYKQQLDAGLIPCKTCAGNAPDGIPARYCSDAVMGPFTWNGKCSTCTRHLGR